MAPPFTPVPDAALQRCEADGCEQAATVIVEGQKLCLDSAAERTLFARELAVSYGAAIRDRMVATQEDANRRLGERG